jgi:AraC-like DNA-binding protein
MISPIGAMTSQHRRSNRLHWTIASAWMRGVADLLRAHGLDVPALFREAGLDIRELEHARSRMPVENVDRLWMLAEQQSKQPSVALSRSVADKPTSFDMLAYSMMSCQNLAQAIERLVQYCAVVSDAVDLRVVAISEGCRIEVTPMEPPQPGRSSRLDYTIVTFLAFCRWVTGRDIIPLGVELAYPAPVDLRHHESAFSCTPRFSAPVHTLLLRKSDLQLLLPTANAALSQLHDRVVQDYIRELHPTGIERQLATSLVRGMASGRLMRRDVASDLCMSDRTLQRRLAGAGTSFQTELDTLRRQLTENYLRDPQIPLAGIASLLGFAEESTFYRACQRWFQMSPKQARDDALENHRTAHSPFAAGSLTQ